MHINQDPDRREPTRPGRSNSLAVLLALLVVLVVLGLLASIALVSLTYHFLVLDGHWSFSSAWLRSADPAARAATLGQLGDYFGGTLGPILSFSGFLVLLITVVVQRRQLEEGTRQQEQSTRAINLKAFVRVHDMLHTPVGIAARKRLQALRDANGQVPPLGHWTADDRQAAETACRQFELVGVLVAGQLFEPTLFLRSWHQAVTRCWLVCEALVAEQRTQLADPGFCRHFEELAALAREAGAPARHVGTPL